MKMLEPASYWICLLEPERIPLEPGMGEPGVSFTH